MDPATITVLVVLIALLCRRLDRLERQVRKICAGLRPRTRPAQNILPFVTSAAERSALRAKLFGDRTRDRSLRHMKG